MPTLIYFNAGFTEQKHQMIMKIAHEPEQTAWY